jgi:hypothetical protein
VWGGEASAVLHPTPDGQHAFLPLVARRVGSGSLRWTVSGETGVYGGPLLHAPMPARAWGDFWRNLQQAYGSMTLFVPPGTVWQPPRHGKGLICHTHRLALEPDGVGAGYNRGLKSRLNKARRLGITVVEGTDAASVEQYVRLYRDTLGRWGEETSWPRPPGFFHALRHHGQPHVKLWLALQEGRTIAGIWVATFGQEAHYLAGSTAEAGLQAGGSHVLLDHAVREAATAGCHYFDFGASGGREGLIRFKEAFGARPTSYGEVHLWSPAVRLYWFLKDSRRQRQALAAPNTVPAPVTAPGAVEEALC